jgi:hypothetical protein
MDAMLLLVTAVGALLAQSRWLTSLKRFVARKEVWFWAHVALQVTGTALIIAAIGIAYRYVLRGLTVVTLCSAVYHPGAVNSVDILIGVVTVLTAPA